ncbi:hypothetical protein PFISCL1PPCAC_11630, partial [Pristionchus fissidentatus]
LSQASIFTAMELLYREMEKLQTQILAIQNSIQQLTELHSPLKSTIDGVSNQDGSQGRNQVRHQRSPPEDAGFSAKPDSLEDDSESILALCNEINSPKPTKFFRLKGKEGVRPLILTSKGEGNNTSLIARPNYSVEEEKVFKSAWADACAKNDAVGRKEFVVRSLRVVQLQQPGDWTKRDRPTRT